MQTSLIIERVGIDLLRHRLKEAGFSIDHQPDAAIVEAAWYFSLFTVDPADGNGRTN